MKATPAITTASTPVDLNNLTIQPPQKRPPSEGTKLQRVSLAQGMLYIRPHLRHARACRSRGIGRVRRRPRRAGARRARPGRAAGTTRRRPTCAGAGRRLRLIFVLPRLPPEPVRVVARVLPPNDDA